MCGDVDIANASQLCRAVTAISGEEDDVATITLDLRGITFIDSRGLSVVLTAYRMLGDRLCILPGERLARLAELTGTRSRLPIVGSAAAH